MSKTTKVPLASLVIASGVWVSLAFGQSQPLRIRGTIEEVDGSALQVKARDGSGVRIVLPNDAVVVGVVRSSLAEVKPGSYTGVAAMPQPDGSQRALEVHVFPEAVRGTGEGHRGWDLRPQSTMTNAQVEQTVASADGQMLTLKYKDGERKVIVPPDTPVVTYAPGDRSELKPGVKIFVNAGQKQPDGTVAAARLNYGKDGLTPPM